MNRRKILWLVSWYPNKYDPYDGDFIQRHARAAAIYHDIHVIFVKAGDKDEEEWHHATGLSEQVVYFKQDDGLLKKAGRHFAWKRRFRNAVNAYLEKNGRPHLVHVHIPWKAGLVAIGLKEKHRLPFLLTEHWGIYNEIASDNFYTKPFWVRHYLKQIYRQSEIFISVSRFLGEGVNRMVAKKPFYVIPNVTDTTLFHYHAGKYSKFSFIHVSNMVPLKNVKLILDAFYQLARESGEIMQLILIGNRDAAWPDYAADLGLLNKSVFFRGEVTYREVSEEMKRSHALIMASAIENSPCVIGEALCCGIPVIATRVGGIPELVHESNSLLIEPGNQPSLFAAMKKCLVEYNRFEGQVIAKEAHQRFGYAVVGKAISDAYEEVIATVQGL